MQGINIYSGSKGLGAALTNPTELSFQKGSIVNHYPVTFRGVEYPSSEHAYQAVKRAGPWLSEEERESLMIEVIEAKLRQHPRLADEIYKRGGEEWLKKCWHKTGATTPPYQLWEGQGMKSLMIRCLVYAYNRTVRERSFFIAYNDGGDLMVDYGRPFLNERDAEVYSQEHQEDFRIIGGCWVVSFEESKNFEPA